MICKVFFLFHVSLVTFHVSLVKGVQSGIKNRRTFHE